MRRRAGGILIRNRKLLLLTGPKADFYWTPGGKLDEKETYEQALVRELEEELHIQPKNISLFHKSSSPAETLNGYFAPESEDKYFLFETDDQLQPDHEIEKADWYTREEIAKLPLLKKFRTNIVSKLIKEKLI